MLSSYNDYNDEAPELEPSPEQLEADYIGSIIECADQAPPLLMDELLIDAAIEDALIERAHTPFRRPAASFRPATSNRRVA